MNPTDTTPSGQAVVKELVVQNKLGIHARPAAMIVRITNKFKAEVFVESKEGVRVLEYRPPEPNIDGFSQQDFEAKAMELVAQRIGQGVAR